MKRWYVVNTKSNQEASAVVELENQNFKVFLPSYLRESKHPKTGNVYSRSLPLFPSYLFVQFDVKRNKRWQRINGMRTVIGLVGYADDYLIPLPKGCVEALIATVDASGHIALEHSVEQILEYSPDMKVEILDGRFKGAVATYCNRSENRVTLLLTLLSTPVKLIIGREAIRPLPLPRS